MANQSANPNQPSDVNISPLRQRMIEEVLSDLR